MNYLFDFDGTLVDSMPIWAGVHIEALKDAGITVPEAFVETITPLGNYNASKYTISLGLDISLEDYLERVSRKLYFEYTTNIGLKPGVKETLIRLRDSGNSLHVLTASPHLYVDECLERTGISALFGHIWSIDDFGLTKAQTEIYRVAAERLQAPVEGCVMVDDNLTAITTAHLAGMKTIAVFDELSKASEAEMRKIADKYIYDFSEM